MSDSIIELYYIENKGKGQEKIDE